MGASSIGNILLLKGSLRFNILIFLPVAYE